MVVLIDCAKCQEEKDCEKKTEFQRRQFSSLASGEFKGCDGYDPHIWRGIEGVAA
jgi:hypothetical protein